MGRSDGESETRVCSDLSREDERMNEMELDAVRVLAGFAQTAGRESRSEAGESSRREEGSGRKRSRRKIDVGSSAPSGSQGARTSAPTDEKEAKKIRRILANRESARETIRRRQAIRDELTKRVSDLSSDNDKLKMEKEMALQEYMSLEETNKQLKEQIARTVRPEVQEGASSAASQQMEVSTSLSTELPLVVHSRPPFTPYMWPSFSSNSSNTSPSYQEGIYPTTCGLKKLFYVPPYSWFYPLIHQLSGYCPPYPHPCSDRDEATHPKEQDPSPHSEAMNDMERTSFCRASKTEVSLPPTVASKKEITVIKTSGKTSRLQTENLRRGSYANGTSDEDETIRDTRETVAGKRKIDSNYVEKPYWACIPPREKEKLVDACTAAEARKRRKELTMIKRQLQLQGKQVRLQR